MGCSGSAPRRVQPSDEVVKAKDGHSVENTKHVRRKSISFKGCIPGTRLYALQPVNPEVCDDYRWYEVEVMESVTDDVIYVHFVGWENAFDKHINIRESIQDGDLTRLILAPCEILSKEQIENGLYLDKSQADAAWYYLRLGVLPVVKSPSVNSISRDNSARKLNNKAESCCHHHKRGDKIDVQEISITAGSRWRKSRVVAVMGDIIRVHYIGLDEKYDENISMKTDSHRVKEMGTMTALQLGHKDSFARKASISDSSGHNILQHSASTPIETYPASRRMSHEGKNISLSMAKVQENSTAQAGRSPSPERSFELGLGIDMKYVEEPSNSGGNSPNWETMTPNSSTYIKRRSSQNMLTPKLQRRQSFPSPGVTRQTEDKFLDIMEQNGLHVIEIEGDGNCLFRAVSHQLYLDEGHHNELRQQAVAHMEKHRERFIPFCPTNFDEHIKNMKTSGYWGDDLEIRALEEILDRIILIYSRESTISLASQQLGPVNNNFQERDLMANVAPMILSYHGFSHYNSVFNEKQSLPLEARASSVLLTERCRLFKELWPDLNNVASPKSEP